MITKPLKIPKKISYVIKHLIFQSTFNQTSPLRADILSLLVVVVIGIRNH